MNRKNWVKIICTIGPSTRDAKKLKRIEKIGIDLARINVSHTDPGQIKKLIHTIKNNTNIPICIDTEGAQIRTGLLTNSLVELKKGSFIKITSKYVLGNKDVISLKPSEAMKNLKPGMILHIDHGKVFLSVVKKEDKKTVIAKVISGGSIGSNKAVSVNKKINLPSITQRDKEAIAIAKKENINIFAFSFVRDKESVAQLRSLAGKNSTIISKIETKDGVRNLDGIIQSSDALLIDRGDLSKELSIEVIPKLQKMIISRAHKFPIPVYVATNLLESMVLTPYPTRAEVNDIANTLLDGANGLVLAAETAIGNYPIECIKMVKGLIQAYNLDITKSLNGFKYENKIIIK